MKLNALENSLFKEQSEELQQNLKLSGVVPVADPILPLWDLPEKTNTVILIGGRGGMKTYGVSQFIAYQAAVNKKRCVILRDEHSLIKESILSEILQRYDDIPFSTNTEKLTTGIKDKESGNELVFTKGFKASDNQKKANMKGVSNIDIAVIEEAEDLTDKDKFNTFVDSLRKEGCLVIILMNTPDIGHFLLSSYFYTNIPAPIPTNIPQERIKDFDGYFEVKPKGIPGFVCIQTGFEENEFLPKNIIDRYNSYGDPASYNFNPHYFMTAIKGYASTGRKGQILRKVKEISLKDYMALPFKEFYGQDFGTASPAGLVGVKFDKNNCYCREINYLPMNTLAIGKLYCTLNFGMNDKIVADSADKDACEKLADGWQAKDLDKEDLTKYPNLIRGFYVTKCVKGEGSIREGISIMDGLNLFAVRESTNLWTEIRNYTYNQDKNGNFTNDPIDDFNHCFIGDTLVTTEHGDIPIKEISEGDKVATTSGFNKVIHRFNNGMRPVNKYTLHFDTFSLSLTCTENHLIKTDKGWVEIKDLKPFMVLHYQRKSLMDLYTSYIQEKGIFQEVQSVCMLLFGNTIMEKLRKDITSIIKTKIRLIIILRTLRQKFRISIFPNILKKDIRKILNGLKELCDLQAKQQKNGIVAQMGKSGIKSKEQKHGMAGNIENAYANSVGKSLKQEPQPIQNIATTTVKLKHLEIEEKGMQQVYDLMVENEHEYMANGIVVHNCIDPWRYVATDQRGKREMFGI